MRIGVIIAIVTDHDARNTASPPTVPVPVPVPDGSRPARIPACGAGDTMKASDVEAAGWPGPRSGLVLPPVIPSQSSGKNAGLTPTLLGVD